MSRANYIISFVISIIFIAAITLYFMLGNPEQFRPLFQSIADPIADVLRGPGDVLRAIVVAVPEWMARSFFILYYLIILVWAFRKDESEVKGEIPWFSKKLDLRIFIALSIAGLVLVYILW